jgi:Ca2+-binding RTX toxin-like protein
LTELNLYLFYGDTLVTIIAGNNNDNSMIYDDSYTVFGYGGNDTLDAGVMFGGLGNDTYIVDAVNDTVVEYAGEGNDTVISKRYSYTLGDNVENLIINGKNGTGNDLANIINGNHLDNSISAKGGDDIIFSGGGNDTVRGGAGADYIWAVGNNYGQGEIDVLIGGSGADKFILASSSQQRMFYSDNDTTKSGLNDYARIQDFEIGVDQIQLVGNASNYFIQTAPESMGISGVVIGYKGQGYAANEVIAILENISYQQFGQGALTTNNFVYV